MAHGKVHQLFGLVGTPPVGEVGLGTGVGGNVVDVVGQATGVLQQVADGDGPAVVSRTGHDPGR